MTTLHLLCAGAAQGLVKALQSRFQAEAGADIQGRFGAVGAMKEALLSGEPCDVMVVTQAMIDSLIAEGRLRAGSSVALGRVRTGVAVKQGAALPDVATPESLKVALLAASAIYFPDPQRATAGIHFANVMRELGIHDALQSRFRTFPNGATAMREMAACNEAGLIGCTQVSEILFSPGVALVDALPKRFELATVYAAAISAAAADAGLAARFIALLTGPDTQTLRSSGGIEA
jgi:molybdate transport system substrate-binding protein